MPTHQFFELFNKQQFDEALSVLVSQNKDDQLEILKQLYYQAREAKTPLVLGVLYRKLHENKTFNDFYNAWLPPKDKMNPITIGNQTYQQFFQAPTRVLNAVNIEDPSDILSVGMVWCDEKDFADNFEQAKNDSANQIRHDSISDVADKISAKIYKVETDTQLGN